jgi:hypothetical protein
MEDNVRVLTPTPPSPVEGEGENRVGAFFPSPLAGEGGERSEPGEG